MDLDGFSIINKPPQPPVALSSFATYAANLVTNFEQPDRLFLLCFSLLISELYLEIRVCLKRILRVENILVALMMYLVNICMGGWVGGGNLLYPSLVQVICEI